MKSFKIPAFIFFVIGCCLDVGGGFWLKSTASFANRAEVVHGQISKQVADTCQRDTGTGSSRRSVSYTCYQPFVKYEFQGQVREAGMSERSSSGYEAGRPADLLVDPANPSKAEFKGGGIWAGPLILLGMGSVFAALGFFLLRSIYRKEGMIKFLQANGKMITGKVTYCGLDTSLTVNGRNPWRVEASWVHPQTKIVYTAKNQEELWYDPSLMDQVTPDGSVQIQYNPENPDQAMVVLGVAGATGTRAS